MERNYIRDCGNLGNSQHLVWITLTRIEHKRKFSTFRFEGEVEIERQEINSILEIFSWKQCAEGSWIRSAEWRYDLEVITMEVVASVMRINSSHKGHVE